MRIISGKSKGKQIHSPKGSNTRPALAKVREAIFSSLGDINDQVVLDVYAGTGSLGLEALSRGAKKSYFIESNDRAVACLIKNIESLGFAEQSQVFKRTLPYGLKRIELDQQPNIIFCDPPYDKNLLNKTLQALVDYKFVDPHSLLIVEHTSREVPNIDKLHIVKQKKYGQTLITYLKFV